MIPVKDTQVHVCNELCILLSLRCAALRVVIERIRDNGSMQQEDVLRGLFTARAATVIHTVGCGLHASPGAQRRQCSVPVPFSHSAEERDTAEARPA